MGKTVLMFSALRIWSVKDKNGAPSFYETIKGYVNNGWRVILVVPYDAKDVELDGVEVVSNRQIPFDSKKNKVAQFVENVIHTKKVTKYFYSEGKRLLQTELADDTVLVYAYEVHAVEAAKKIAKLFGVPFVTRFQGTIMSGKKNNLLNRIGYYPHYQALREKSDLVVMTNDGTQGEEYLKKIGNTSKVLFLRNGVDIRRINDANRADEIRRQYGITKEDKVLMTISRLVNWKRLDRAINAMPEVIKEFPNCKLVIIGDGDYKEEYERLSSSLKLQNNVIFTGAIKQKDVAEYLQIADIFLSLYDLSNVGNPMFEAMKCGKAIITLNNGDTGKLLTPNKDAVLLEMEQIPELSNVIVELLQNDELRRNLGKAAQEHADTEFWTWEDRMLFECNETSKLLEG